MNDALLHRTDRRTRLLDASRRRRDAGGTVMFLVATSMALMAPIGFYALTSSPQEVKVSGYTRPATHAAPLSERTMYSPADFFSSQGSDFLVRMMTGQLDNGGTIYQTQNCVSALPYSAAAGSDLGKACKRIVPADIQSAWGGSPLTTGYGGSLTGNVWAEATDPFYTAPPPGTNLAANMKYISATITTAGIIEVPGGIKTPVYGRGRIIVGPIVVGSGG